jgi:hypothetical protein
VVDLLLDVLFEIRGERLGQRVGIGQISRAPQRYLGQRDGRSDDLVLLDQVRRPQLGEPRVLDERLVGRCQRTNGDGDLPPEADAGRVGSRGGPAQ